ncbi:MAG TPA: 30S ribosome-binding factor RbfA [Desulfuromonadales bacterium]|nr:30S ribosome-binding factor RbfA [Desulfuromonadales bacterium]
MSVRTRRVGELIHQEISTLLISGLKDPRVGFVTITGVDVSPDLRSAKVYFSVIGDDKSRRETEAGLKSSVPFIRQHLGSKLRMKYTPDLQFHYDESVEYGNRIEGLLKEIKQEESND